MAKLVGTPRPKHRPSPFATEEKYILGMERKTNDVPGLLRDMRDAIRDEEEAADLYDALARRAGQFRVPGIPAALQAIAADERRHKARLSQLAATLQAQVRK